MRFYELSLTLEEALLACDLSPWTIMESADGLQVDTSAMWAATLADKRERMPNIEDRVREFLRVKASNPIQPYGGSDTPFNSKAPIGSINPKMRHAHVSRDLSIYYTIEGRNPVRIKLYGIFDHKESGTGTPANIKIQKQLAKKLQNS